jgi:DNA-binding NarL/FixJ family response regulator
VRAIREVQKGNAFFSPAIARRAQSRCQQLTTRETEVLRLIAEGLRNKQIADGLGISIKTVEQHRQKVMKKLNIHEVAGLTRYAVAKELVELDVPADLPVAL